MVSECPIGLCIACSIANVQIFQAPGSTMDLNIVSLGLLMSLVTGSFGGTDPWVLPLLIFGCVVITEGNIWRWKVRKHLKASLKDWI